MFYKRSEQPLRLAIWLSGNGVATMLGALLGFGLGHSHDTQLHSWQLIFLTFGLLNFVCGCIFLWLMPDSPNTAHFLTHKQRIVAVQRVAANMIGVKTKEIKPRQAIEIEIAYDLKVLSCIAVGIACGIINGGVSNFASALIKGYGFSGINATLLQLPTGAFEAFIVPLCGLIVTFIPNSRCAVLAGVCLVPFSGLLGIRFTELDQRWTLVGCTWLQYIVGAPVVISWNILTTNVAGHTKRSVANGLWFTMYAAGNVAGANIFFERGTAVLLGIGGVVGLLCGDGGFGWGYVCVDERGELEEGQGQGFRFTEDFAGWCGWCRCSYAGGLGWIEGFD